MSTTETTTTIFTSSKGEVTTTVVTRVLQDVSDPQKDIEEDDPISAEEKAYRDAIKALKGAGGGLPQGAGGSPELEEGTMHVTSGVIARNVNNTRPLDEVEYVDHCSAIVYVTRTNTNPETYREEWVVLDPRFFDGMYTRVVSVNSGTPDWTARLAEFKTSGDLVAMGLDWHNFRHATAISTSQPWLTQAQIDAVPATPANHERRIFDLWIRRDGQADVKGGVMFRDVSPIGGLGWTEHWCLVNGDYVRPHGGRLDQGQGGPVLDIVPRVPGNVALNGDGFPIMPGASDLKAVLQEFNTYLASFNPAKTGIYIQVDFTWAGLP